MSVSRVYLEEMKTAARVNGNDFDDEVETYILAARDELAAAGIIAEKCNDESDATIKRAIMVYVRAEYGLNNPDRDSYLASFESIKKSLALRSEYTRGEE